MKIALLTESRYENPTVLNPYISNILEEDHLLKEALKSKGLEVIRKNWSDPDFDWSDMDYSVFRSTWDYFDDFENFKPWFNIAKYLTRFINTDQQILWNMDKHYLLDLEHRGIRIPKTISLPKNTSTTLKSLQEIHNWNDFILKPMISGAARHTYKLNTSNLESHETLLAELLEKEDMMVQDFQNNIMEKGEVSLMVFGGKYSHSILKIAKKGDFRVQDDFGGTVHEYEASAEEIKFAEKVVSLCSPVPVYARVDATWDSHGNFTLMELELIEPELWMRFKPESADLFADAIIDHINQH